MKSQPVAIEPLVIDTWNATLAGKTVSTALAGSLCNDWLPALSSLLRREGRQGVHWQAGRQLLARLGRLLQVLPLLSGQDPLRTSVTNTFRRDLRRQSITMFDDVVQRLRVLQVMDEELLSALRAVAASPGSAMVSRAPLAPIMGATSAVAATKQPSTNASSPLPPATTAAHPHDREASGAWRAVLADSRIRRRGEHTAMTSLERVAELRAGDRISLLLPGGVLQTWRVLRREPSRHNLLMESEDTHRQGVLGLQSLAAQLSEGRLAILA